MYDGEYMLMKGSALEFMQMMVIEGKCGWTKVNEALYVSIQFKVKNDQVPSYIKDIFGLCPKRL